MEPWNTDEADVADEHGKAEAVREGQPWTVPAAGSRSAFIGVVRLVGVPTAEASPLNGRIVPSHLGPFFA